MYQQGSQVKSHHTRNIPIVLPVVKKIINHPQTVFVHKTWGKIENIVYFLHKSHLKWEWFESPVIQTWKWQLIIRDKKAEEISWIVEKELEGEDRWSTDSLFFPLCVIMICPLSLTYITQYYTLMCQLWSLIFYSRSWLSALTTMIIWDDIPANFTIITQHLARGF